MTDIKLVETAIHSISLRYPCTVSLISNLVCLPSPQSFLAVPIIASGSSGCIIGALSFGLTSIQDWGSAWWMSSIQLLCGWAAGALPQNRATYRAGFFDALWNTRDLDSLGAVFVHQLPHALVDQVGRAAVLCCTVLWDYGAVLCCTVVRCTVVF